MYSRDHTKVPSWDRDNKRAIPRIVCAGRFGYLIIRHIPRTPCDSHGHRNAHYPKGSNHSRTPLHLSLPFTQRLLAARCKLYGLASTMARFRIASSQTLIGRYHYSTLVHAFLPKGRQGRPDFAFARVLASQTMDRHASSDLSAMAGTRTTSRLHA